MSRCEEVGPPRSGQAVLEERDRRGSSPWKGMTATLSELKCSMSWAIAVTSL